MISWSNDLDHLPTPARERLTAKPYNLNFMKAAIIQIKGIYKLKKHLFVEDICYLLLVEFKEWLTEVKIEKAWSHSTYSKLPDKTYFSWKILFYQQKFPLIFINLTILYRLKLEILTNLCWISIFLK